MLRKSFVLVTLFALLSLVAYAQEKDKAPKTKVADAKKAYSLAFSGGSYLGVEIKEVTKKNFAELGLSEVRGVGVSKVIADSPAEKAGLAAGDVIVAFNGEAVTSSRKLRRLISEVAPDHKAKLTVLRGGSEVALEVTVGKRPGLRFSQGNFVFTVPDAPIPPNVVIPKIPEIRIAPGGSGKSSYVFSIGQRRTIGIGVGTMTKQLGEYFGVENGEGVLVNKVVKDSPAERAGLEAGDVIVEVNGKAVKGRGGLVKAINAEKEGDITLTFIRDKNRQTVTVTPEKSKGPALLYDGLRVESGLRVAPGATVRVGPKARRLARPVIVGIGTQIL